MRVAVRMAAVCALAMALQCAYGADASGNWKGSFDFQGTTVDLTFHLTIVGSTVTGTVEGLPTSPATIEDGKVSGDTVTFAVNTDYQGQTYQLVYQGNVSGDAIDFNFGTPDGSWNAEVMAKRGTDVAAAPDVSGDWSGAFDFQGTSVPLMFHLTSAGGVLTGTVDGLGTSPTEIHDAKVVGETLTFWLNTDYQGQTYRLDYSGKVAPDHIDFSFGTQDGSWGTTLAAKKNAATPVAAAVPATAPAATPAAAPAVAPASPVAPSTAPVPATVPAQAPTAKPTPAQAPSSPRE